MDDIFASNFATASLTNRWKASLSMGSSSLFNNKGKILYPYPSITKENTFVTIFIPAM
jgi:hypothetical protein